MMRILVALAIVLSLSACSERPGEKISPIGIWQNPIQWDNNLITLHVLPDSTMLFKVEKSFCPGTKFFVSQGKWHVEQDSFLVMEPFSDGRVLDVKATFPELAQLDKDSANILSIEVSARLLFDKDHVYDVQPDGKRSGERVYNKIKELKADSVK